MTSARPMFPPLRVVDGVGNAAASIEDRADCDDLGPAIRYLGAGPARCAALAEADAARVADLLAPAVAVVFKTGDELARIVAADVAEAVKVRDRLREAAAAARAVFGVFEAADARLLEAICVAATMDGVAP